MSQDNRRHRGEGLHPRQNPQRKISDQDRIHQRQQTISNIAHEIVARQQEFLDFGPSALKPMTMVQIADAVGVHETTVSRAISGKYMPLRTASST